MSMGLKLPEDGSRHRPTIDCGPGRTKQSFKDQCDINKIVASFERTQDWTHVAQAAPMFGDFSQITDFQTAVNKVAEVNASFMELPAEIRQRMDNDPNELLAFLSDDENLVEAVELGLVEVPPKEKIVPTAQEMAEIMARAMADNGEPKEGETTTD